MLFPISKEEKSLLKEIEERFAKAVAEKDDPTDHRCSILITNEDYLRYQDWMDLLVERGYVSIGPYDDKKICVQYESFDGFNDWICSQNKKGNRLKRRDWLIGIIGAVVGVILDIIRTALLSWNI